MSIIQSANLFHQFDIRLGGLSYQFYGAPSTDMSAVMQSFEVLVKDVSRNNDIDVLFNILKLHQVFVPPSDPGCSLKFVHCVLKTVQYGLSQKTAKEYKAKWDLFTDDQLVEKIKKLQKKVDQLKEAISHPIQPKNTATFSKAATKSSSMQSSFIGSLTKMKGQLSSPSFLKKNSNLGKKSHSHLPISEIFSAKKKAEPVFETSKNETDSTSLKKEVYYWNNFRHLSLMSESSPLILKNFRECLMEALHKDPAFIKASTSCKDEEENGCLIEGLSFYLDGVLYGIEQDLNQFNSSKEISLCNFIAYAFLFHLYDASLRIDALYINQDWIKPRVINDIQNILHFEKQLKESKIEQIPIFKERWGKILFSESTLAYSFYRKKDPKNRFVSRKGFDKMYPMDPLTASGCGHRKSAAELPKWLLTWFD